ncbi:hypothetical protein HWV23_02720 [Natronomonas halophila]|uniref:hypothetical protein n=1 Tax=Natronomonas halophila TaxID=2747817 RepID=UPI0015B3F7CE|nr:hypothetical protein [Natronomonas halophila]QLD84615.1 hypothetical protein HWV23_02445 [Natronomonas halophila]QLD84669.1 hypothetical protein HWV23_02720 [Natronomonas halophila]
MAIADQLQTLRQRAERRAKQRERERFETELERAQREADGGRLTRLKSAAQEAAKPARIEARGAVQEAKQLAAQSPRDVAAVAGSAAASAGRSAVSSIDAPASTAGGDDEREQVLRNAERSAQAAAPVDATLDPVTSPQDLAAFVTGRSARAPGRQPGPAVDQLVLPNRNSAGMEAFVLGGGGPHGGSTMHEYTEVVNDSDQLQYRQEHNGGVETVVVANRLPNGDWRALASERGNGQVRIGVFESKSAAKDAMQAWMQQNPHGLEIAAGAGSAAWMDEGWLGVGSTGTDSTDDTEESGFFDFADGGFFGGEEGNRDGPHVDDLVTGNNDDDDLLRF